ncbi:hypothetical protein A9K75_08545 [Campylobacter fetus subsp. testudinum]|uniref:hypothetical protein n=1 Tax=Campylobacter fetus TaxID=196 RepID=UPI000818809B|nr:hypothetical protein [Campylobacter fetus]OCR99084.1 hypothetical protein A9K75_08545 [Campylobacter fetus subsp. testudinum]
MTGMAIGLSVFALIFYAIFSTYNDKGSKGVIQGITAFMLGSIWCSYILMLGYTNNADKFWYLLFIITTIAMFLYIKSINKPTTVKIVAKQQNYWDIDPKFINNFYSYRRNIKHDRIEVTINKLSKNIYRTYSNENKYITSNLFREIKALELTIIKSVEELQNIPLYNVIFKKIKELMDSQERQIDFGEILIENENIAEYFLIDCWVRFTKPFNIGTANLEVLANNFTQEQLVGAIDNADLSSIKRNGASLYFKYALFKHLIPGQNDEELEVKNHIEETEEADKVNCLVKFKKCFKGLLCQK